MLNFVTAIVTHPVHQSIGVLKNNGVEAIGTIYSLDAYHLIILGMDFRSLGCAEECIFVAEHENGEKIIIPYPPMIPYPPYPTNVSNVPFVDNSMSESGVKEHIVLK